MSNLNNLTSKGFADPKNKQHINTAGRPKKIKHLLRRKNYTKDQIKDVFENMAYYTLSEVKKLGQDYTKPIIVNIVAHQYYKALVKGDWHKIKEIIELVVGKPSMTIEQNTRIIAVADPFKDIRESLNIDDEQDIEQNQLS